MLTKRARVFFFFFFADVAFRIIIQKESFPIVERFFKLTICYNNNNNNNNTSIVRVDLYRYKLLIVDNVFIIISFFILFFFFNSLIKLFKIYSL
jgi:hypothetical protein